MWSHFVWCMRILFIPSLWAKGGLLSNVRALNYNLNIVMSAADELKSLQRWQFIDLPLALTLSRLIELYGVIVRKRLWKTWFQDQILFSASDAFIEASALNLRVLFLHVYIFLYFATSSCFLTIKIKYTIFARTGTRIKRILL